MGLFIRPVLFADTRIVLVLALLGVGMALSRFQKGESIVQGVTQFLTFVVVPLLLYFDCACLSINDLFIRLLAISLTHVFLIYVVADLLIGRVNMHRERRAAALLASCLPNVVYLPYSIYAVFSLDTAPLVPYVIAANVLLPVVLVRAQLAARSGSRIGVKDLLATVLISIGILAGLVTAVLAPSFRMMELVARARQILSRLMLLAFTVLGYEIAKVRAVTRDMLYPLIFRVLLSPVLMVIMLHILNVGFTPDILRGLLTESFAPSAIATVLYSRLLGFDSVYAATAVSITTLITLPIMLIIACSTVPSM